MKAEIITIGDELLIGQVIDTNSSWIAEQLNLIGITTGQITCISDNREHILSTLGSAEKNSEIILLTGGLGPTKDDITKSTLCEFFDTKLVFNEDAYKVIENLFRLRGFPVTELNRKQAEVPENCTPIPNSNGTAPGMWFEKNGKIFVSMPGVPFEMKSMIINYVLPRLATRFNSQFIVHKTILTHGIGESFLAKKIEDWENNLPENIKLAYLPQPGIVRLRLTATGKNKDEMNTRIEEQEKKLKAQIPELIFGYDDDTLEKIIGSYLKNKNQTVSTAESCTGGYVAHLITGVAGSSDYYKGSVIAYSNEIKEKLLGVKHESLENYGAVSEEVVKQMAVGAQKKLQTDFALATSGIAGPDGGTKEKPVGTVWIACATPEKVITEKFLFGEHRGRNIRKSALAALNMLRLELES